MNFVNQFSKQISELFRSMTPGSRIGIGLLFALLVVGMFLLFSGKVVQSGQYLFGGESFSRTQIQLMEAAFAEEGLSDWTVEGSRVKIKGNKSDYIAALVKHKAMPAGCYDEMDEALANMGIMDLPDKVKESIKNANIKSLEQMISGLHAIEKAKVLCYREKTHNFSGVDRCSAIVTVKPALGESIDAKLAKTVQEMAARGLGIPMADISVTDDSTSHSFSVDLSSGEIASNQLKSEYETEWERKIRELLNIAGITVAVNVELDPYESRRELKFTPDKKPVTKSSYNKTSKVDRKAPAPGGRPGFSSNQPNRLVQTATQMSTDTENNNENIQDNVIGRMNEEVSYATGRQKQVNVSIHIPSDHYAKVWKSRNPTPEGEEAKEPTPAELATIETETVAKAKQSVANLLSAVGGDKAADWVYVATKDSLALPPVEEPGMVAMAAGWLKQYWTVLGLFVLAFLSLRILRTAMRATPVEISDTEVDESEDDHGLEMDKKTSEMASAMLRHFEGNSPSLRDELSALVNEDTDAAATILRSWIGTPAGKS